MKRNLMILVLVNVLSALALGGFYFYRHVLPGLHRPAPAPRPEPKPEPGPSPEPGPAPEPVPAPAAPPAESLPTPALPTPALPTPASAGAAPQDRGELVANLSDVEGSVRSRSGLASAWQNVQQKAPLYGNDAIRTYEKASASITFGAGDVIRVDQNSLVIIQPRRPEAKADEITLSVLPGAFLDRIEAMPAPERAQALEAAVAKTRVTIRAVAGKAGKKETTRIAVRSLPDNSAGLQALAGTMKVVSPRGEELVLQEKMVTKIGAEAKLAKPRSLPSAPDLVSPQDGATYGFQSRVPRAEVKWKAAESAARYRIVVANDRAFRAIFADETVDGTSLTIANLQPGTYFWRVGAVDADGYQGPFSAVRTLKTTYDDVPPKLALLTPPEIYVSPGPSVNLKGKTEAGARVKVNGQKVTVAPDGSFTLALSLKEGVNLVTVEAVDPAGNSEYGKRVITYKGAKRSAASAATRTQ